MRKKQPWKPDKKEVGLEVKYYYFRMNFKPEVRQKLGDEGMKELERRIRVEAKLVREKIKEWVNAAHESL